ncbi:MAG TPA: PEP-CTERM sorting domain-containing protein [Candidatus Acidoferrum sp.]|nr:PEP-CTERM sorting domain-containing protein [Candidatus Acidoferrum sp.]
MKAKISFIVGAVVLTVACVSAQAQVPITGQINFTGGATIDASIPNATTFETFFGPSGSGGLVVQAGGGLPSGSYAGVPGNTVANFKAPFDFGTPTLPFALWTFNFGAQTYSFQVNTVSTDLQFTTPFDYVNVGGTGTGTITGGSTTYLPTTEDWSITGTTAAGGLTITIGASNVAIPEPSTLAFGGLGSLLSIATLIRRK